MNKKEALKIRQNIENAVDLGQSDRFRIFIAKEATFIAMAMLKDVQYQGLMEGLGRLQYLAELCKADGYWQEKIDIGYEKEKNALPEVIKGTKPLYHGYGQKTFKRGSVRLELD